MTATGHFISFEGIDRSGKSTQAALLADSLGDDALLVREPGGTQLSERARTILKDPAIPLAPRAEALLFAAARADLTTTVIGPAIEQGKIVIADRFIDSSLAYQGVARGLGIDAINKLNAWATEGLTPELTILIEIDAETARERGAEENDRFEDEGASFQQQVAAAYEQLAAADPDRIIRIDGARTPDAVSADVQRTIAERLGLVLR